MARLRVRVQPRASRNQLAGCEGGVWRLRLTAPPVEGQANAALVELLAELLAVRKADVAVLRGHTGRDKLVEIAGLSDAEAQRRLATRL